ncbi:hypothetical protein KI387_035659, partial [Taxus chinensis]
LKRCGKSCRLRWLNYLRPGLKRGAFSLMETKIIVEAHAAFGNRWSVIANLLPGRTDNDIKNLWNSSIKKKIFFMGVDHRYNKRNVSSISCQMNKQEKQNCRDFVPDAVDDVLEKDSTFHSNHLLEPFEDESHVEESSLQTLTWEEFDNFWEDLNWEEP